MSTPTGTQTTESILDDRAVAEYLQAHPDYFQRHETLLESLTIPHQTGAATSLIERQVNLLKQQKKSQDQQLQNLIKAARNSEQIIHRMQRFTLEIMRSHSVDDIITTCQETMSETFNADYIGIQLIGDDNNQHPAFVSNNDQSIQQFTTLFEQKKPACGKITDMQAQILFAENAEHVMSAVLIPLQDTQNLGVIALGSQDERRFQADMGTLFLTYLGEVVTASLNQHLDSSDA